MEKNLEKNIKKLVRVNLDAHEGYKTAADNTNDSLLNTFLNQCAKDRKAYALDLAKAINLAPEKTGTDFMADLHRVWIDLKTSSQKFNAKAVLNECERGEKHALDAYNDAAEDNGYPASVEKLIKIQQEDINSKYERVRKLKKEYDLKDDSRNQQTPVP